jgi:hypothetical protein
MRVIIVDGFHKGHVLDLPNPSPTIKLIKPKSVTVCGCDDLSIERFGFDAAEITYQLAFKSVDGKTALYSEKGDSYAIFNSGFEHEWWMKPWGRNEVLHFGCHDYNAWR